jgi:hypothetical protein
VSNLHPNLQNLSVFKYFSAEVIVLPVTLLRKVTEPEIFQFMAAIKVRDPNTLRVEEVVDCKNWGLLVASCPTHIS